MVGIMRFTLFSIYNLSSTEGEDVQPFTLETIEFLPNSSSEAVSFTLIDNDSIEEREEFLLMLSIPTEQERVVIGVENTTIVIIDDDSKFYIVALFCHDHIGICVCVCLYSWYSEPSFFTIHGGGRDNSFDCY